MLKNYILIAFRNIRQHKVYSFINIFGLAVGLACCILILNWIFSEFSYEKFNENYDNIYRLESKIVEGQKFPNTTAPIGPALKADYPEIKKVGRISTFEPQLVQANDKFLEVEHINFIDAEFFEIFTFPFIQGNAHDALKDDNAVVFTESLAKKFFGNKDPIGESIVIEGEHVCEITGVIKDVPTNSDFRFEILLPFSKAPEIGERPIDSWSLTTFFTFMLLEENVNHEALAKKFENYYQSINIELRSQLYLRPIRDVHLFTNYRNGGMGHIKFVIIFGAIGLIILLIACINFMNLSTARSGIRAKEIGMRKVVGADRTAIMKQFFGEALVYAFLAMVLGLIIAEMALPIFNEIADKSLELKLLDWKFLASLLGVTIFTGLIAGSYPAIFISSFDPIKVVNKFESSSRFSLFFRKFLVIVQFSVSIILIIVTLFIYKQLSFIRAYDLGFAKDRQIYIPIRGSLGKNYELIKQELLLNPNIESVTAGEGRPNRTYWRTKFANWEGKIDDKQVLMGIDFIDFDYLKTFDLKLVAGRDFEKENSDDKANNFILNQAAIKLTGLQDPVGKEFAAWGKSGRIIGVVQDYVNVDVRSGPSPLILNILDNDFNAFRHIFIKLKSDNMAKTIEEIKQVCLKYNPDFPFESHFFDDDFDVFYRHEQGFAKMINTFSIIAILICSLGLYGLAAFTVERRTKEIGIRKVLGIKFSGIIYLLSKDFIKWVLIANLLAVPIAYYTVQNWLENFAFKTDMSWWIFLTAGMISFMIAFLTVLGRTLNAVKTDPIQSLRYE